MDQLVRLDLEATGYAPTFRLQRRLVRKVQANPDAPIYLLLLEHDPPVITLGRRGREEHVLASRETLDAAGIEIHTSNRGGEVTYHGAGQLVGYVILSLHAHEMKLRDYVYRLERTLLRLLEHYGVDAQRGRSQPGIWVHQKKIAAIGIAVSRWVTYHGFALNVKTDLSHFDWIVPCGVKDKGVVNLTDLIGDISVSTVTDRYVECFAREFGIDPENIRRDRGPDTP